MRSKEQNFLSAVIYVHNAEERVKQFIQMIIRVLEEHFDHSEIICVNDCSSDGSVARIKEAAEMASSSSISVVNLSSFHGLESAMTAGMNLAIGDFVLEFDSTYIDFAEDEIMNVYRKVMEGYDIVSAVPDGKKRISSELFYRILFLFSEPSLRFETERFRILSRRVINRIENMNRTIPYRKVVYTNAGLKMISLKYSRVETSDRNVGKEDPKERRYRRTLAVDTLILFTDVGYRFSSGMTIVMMVFAFIMAVYSVCVYLSSTPVAGWTTTVFFLSGAFFGLFGILTVIIKYLQILVKLVFRRKQYSFESIEKITH